MYDHSLSNIINESSETLNLLEKLYEKETSAVAVTQLHLYWRPVSSSPPPSPLFMENKMFVKIQVQTCFSFCVPPEDIWSKLDARQDV